MKDYRDRLQKRAEQGEISPIEYWHMLVVTWQLMDSKEKQKEYKELEAKK